MRRVLWLFLACFCLFLAGCDKPQQKQAKHIERGNAYFVAGEFDKARIEYKNAARLIPSAAEPYYRLALIDEEQGQMRNAYAGFTAAEQQDSHFHPAVLKIAQYYMGAEQYEETRRRIDMVLGENPENAEAHALLGALLLRQKDLENAEKEARLALAKDPMNLSAYAALTGIYAAKNDIGQADAVLAEGIARHPRNASLMMLRVLLYQKTEDMPKIAEAYRALFALKPEGTRFRTDLASLYIQKGRLDEAEAVLREGVKALPDHWGMKHQLALFLDEKRGIDVAEAEIKNLMQAYPDNDDLYFWLADLYARHNASDKAVALLERVVSKNENSAPGLNARVLLARINIQRGNVDLAEKLVATVLSKTADNQPALFVRANLSFGKGYYQSAVSDLRALLRGAPSDVDALQLLAETFLMQRRVDLAVDTIKKIVALSPADKIARVRLAQIIHASGDAKQAMDKIALVTKTFPDYPVGWETAARFAIDAKQVLPAEAAIRELDKLEGQHLTAVFLTGQLLAANNRNDEAAAKFVEIIDGDPSAPLAEHALRSLISIYEKQQQVDVAAQYLETLKIETPLLSTLLGRCYAKLGRTDAAAVAFDKAIAARAAFADPYRARAELFLKEGKQEPAIETLKIGMQAARGDFLLPMMLAGLLGEDGKYQEALALYDDILLRDPEFAPAANNLAELTADYMPHDSLALEKARLTAERFSGSSNPYFLDTLAWVYFRQGKVDLAQTLMERAMGAANPIPPQMHYHYGALLLKSGKTDRAKEELLKALTGEEHYPGKEEAKSMFNAL